MRSNAERNRAKPSQLSDCIKIKLAVWTFVCLCVCTVPADGLYPASSVCVCLCVRVKTHALFDLLADGCCWITV